MELGVSQLVLSVIFAALLLAACTPVEETATIGALLPLSGPNAAYGLEGQTGIELAVAEINAAGGIDGRPLGIIYEDDQADPRRGTEGMQKLVNVHNVPVVLGSWSSGVVMATAPIAEQTKTIVMCSAISPAISDAGEYIFRAQPSAIKYIEGAMQFLAQYDNAAIIYLNNEFGKANKDVFAGAYPGEVVAVEAYEQGATDYLSQLSKIKEVNPDVLFVAGYQEIAGVIKQAKELGITAQVMATPTFENPAMIETLGPIAEEVIFPYHFAAGADNPQAQHYERAYVERYGEETRGFAPPLYDSVHMMAQAMNACAQKTAWDDTDCIKNELYAIAYDGVMGLITFDANGDPSMPIVMKTVRNGRFVAVE